MRERMRFFVVLAAAAFLGGSALPAGATMITFDVVSLGGATYEYTYTVVNTLADPIEEIAIYFDVSLFANLRAPVAPTGWDPIVIQPDPVLGDDGFFDALAIGGGISTGMSLGGFSVVADYLGVGAPGSQSFEIIDPATFNIVASGVTVRSVPVPEPATPLMLIAGLLALRGLSSLGVGRRHRARVRVGPRVRGQVL